MDKNPSLTGILVGLLLGSVIGAGFFFLTGSLNLRLGFGLMILFSLIGSVTGWFIAPSIAKKREASIKPLIERTEFTTIIENVNTDKNRNTKVISSEEYYIDYLRLGSLSILFLFISLGFGYLTWYEGIDFLVFVILFLVISLYQLGVLIAHIGIQVTTRPDGFQYKTWGKSRIIKWMDVEYIWEKHEKTSVNFIPMSHIHYIKLTLQDGTKIKLNRSLRNFSELADYLQEAVTKYQLPIANQGIDSGKLINFGVFKLTNKGIQYKQEQLPWSEIDRIMIYQARIQVRRTGKNWFNWAETKTWNVPNFRLFVILASKFSKVV